MDNQKQSNYTKIKCPTHILIVFYFLECFYFPKLFYEQMRNGRSQSKSMQCKQKCHYYSFKFFLHF